MSVTLQTQPISRGLMFHVPVAQSLQLHQLLPRSRLIFDFLQPRIFGPTGPNRKLTVVQSDSV